MKTFINAERKQNYRITGIISRKIVTWTGSFGCQTQMNRVLPVGMEYCYLPDYEGSGHALQKFTI